MDRLVNSLNEALDPSGTTKAELAAGLGYARRSSQRTVNRHLRDQAALGNDD